MSYTANDIVSLSAGAAFRSKIGMYLSADRQEAINLGLRELIVNVQDEYEVFKPKDALCEIVLNSKTKEISVRDNMRGIPVGIREDGMNSLTAAFLIPHSGGKHTEGAYSSAIGINGEGNKVVCHTAKWLEVTVKRDGKIYFQRFESTSEGATAVEDVKVIGSANDTGTYIKYLPDEEVYGDCFVDIKSLEQMLKELSYFTKGLTIKLNIDGEEKVFFSKNGLIDGLENPKAVSKPFSYFYEAEDCKVELALQWVSSRGTIRGYANGLYMPDGGAFISGFRSSLTRTFNSLSDGKFDGENIRTVLDGFVSVKVKMGQFSNQAKTALANPEARSATSTAISNALKEYAASHAKDFATVVEILKRTEKAEAAAEKARNAILNVQKELKRTNKKSLAVEKLKDCKFHTDESRLYICEGDSALGSFVAARDSSYVAAMPIKGKIISALKHPIEEVLDNDEVKAIIKALGCGFLDSVDVNKMRYGRVYFAADADPDGYSIVCLLLILFWKLFPDLIKEGRVFWAQFPLFEIEGKGETRFAYTEDEIGNVPKGFSVNRNKGLGEMRAETFARAAFGEESRSIQFTMDDIPAAQEILDTLLGNDTENRKDYIFKNVDFKTVEGE